MLPKPPTHRHMQPNASLRNVTVLIVDCQTTGATPDKGELLDLAWTFTSAELSDASHIDGGLLKIDGEIPRRIARITGVTAENLEDATDPEELRDQFLRAREEHSGIVLAHYARFEQRFLDDFLSTAEWDTELMCTHAIARRLLPDLPRLGIRALSGFFGTSMDEEKRAAGHVAASARIWSELVELLAEEGVETVDELESWLANTAKPKRSGRARRFPLPREQRLGLPEIPGVYRMLARDGVVLYVGKATSLKSRVNSYYRGKRGEGERKLELVTQVWDLDVTPTETPLHAAILEQREIKSHEPPYNHQFRTHDRELAWVDPADLGSWSPRPTQRHTLGPLPSTRSLDAAVWLLRAARGTVEPLPFTQLDAAVLADGVERFAAEAESLELGPERWNDSGVLVALGQHYRALDEAAAEAEAAREDELETENDLDEGSPSADDWTADDVVEYVRWVTKGMARTVRRAEAFDTFRDGELEWASPITGEQSVIVWRAGRVVEPDAAESSANADAFDLLSYDETSVLIGELKRLVRYGAELSLDTGRRTFDTDELAAFFSR